MTDIIPNRASGYHWLVEDGIQLNGRPRAAGWVSVRGTRPKSGFDLLERQETIRDHQMLNGIIPSDNPLPQFWEGDIQLTLFNFVSPATTFKDERIKDQASCES